MAGTSFSPDSGNRPRPRFGAGPGPLDRRSDRARRRLAPRPAQGGTAGGQQAPAQQASPQGEHGHPDLAQQAPAGDYRHVQLLAQHANISRLGREIAFGNWANLSGEGRQLMKPGQVPIDIFEDAS